MTHIVGHCAGVSGSSPADLSARLAKAHGAVQVMGWGLLLPIGALIARYCRAWDPAWFYVHVAFQSIGFIFVMAGIGTGVVLSHRVRPSGFYTHRGLGIIIFFLACLQVNKPYNYLFSSFMLMTAEWKMEKVDCFDIWLLIANNSSWVCNQKSKNSTNCVDDALRNFMYPPQCVISLQFLQRLKLRRESPGCMEVSWFWSCLCYCYVIV